MVFPIVMYGCESWTIKKAECWRIGAFKLQWWRRLLRVSWTTRRWHQSILKETNSIFIGRTVVEAEASILWLPDAKSWLVEKDPDAGTEWRQKQKGAAEDEMVWWHHRLNGHESEQSLGDIGGQRSLACCSPWGHNLATEQQQQGQMKTLTWKNTCPLRVLETLFTIAKTRTQPKWP